MGGEYKICGCYEREILGEVGDEVLELNIGGDMGVEYGDGLWHWVRLNHHLLIFILTTTVYFIIAL